MLKNKKRLRFKLKFEAFILKYYKLNPKLKLNLKKKQYLELKYIKFRFNLRYKMFNLRFKKFKLHYKHNYQTIKVKYKTLKVKKNIKTLKVKKNIKTLKVKKNIKTLKVKKNIKTLKYIKNVNIKLFAPPFSRSLKKKEKINFLNMSQLKKRLYLYNRFYKKYYKIVLKNNRFLYNRIRNIVFLTKKLR
jgi:hypothetical protein